MAVIGVPPQSPNPPELSTDNSRRADVMESDPVGHAVAFITANDPDGDMLWYKIEGRLPVLSVSFVSHYERQFQMSFLFHFMQTEISATNSLCRQRATARSTLPSLSTGKSSRPICSTSASPTAITQFTLRFHSHLFILLLPLP